MRIRDSNEMDHTGRMNADRDRLQALEQRVATLEANSRDQLEITLSMMSATMEAVRILLQDVPEASTGVSLRTRNQLLQSIDQALEVSQGLLNTLGNDEADD